MNQSCIPNLKWLALAVVILVRPEFLNGFPYMSAIDKAIDCVFGMKHVVAKKHYNNTFIRKMDVVVGWWGLPRMWCFPLL